MVYAPSLQRITGSRFDNLPITLPHLRKSAKILGNSLMCHEFYLTSAQLLALNATPVTVLAAPGAGYATILERVTIYKPAGTAYAGIAAGEDLAFNYTNNAGLQLASCETTGFLDQTTAQVRIVNAYRAASGVSDITPVANAVIIIQLLSGEITTGNSPLQMRIYYRVESTDLSSILSTQNVG